MNFGDSSHKTTDMPDCFRLLGPKMAPPSRNRVKQIANIHFTTYTKESRRSYKDIIIETDFQDIMRIALPSISI